MLFDVDNMTDFANETDLNFLSFFDAPGCIAEPLQETQRGLGPAALQLDMDLFAIRALKSNLLDLEDK